MRWGWLSGVVLLLTGCPPAGSISGKVGSDGSGGSVAVAIPGEPIAPREAFETAFQSWVTGSVAADFDDARCSAVVTSFVDVAARTTGNKRWKALYNAAVARQRCGKHIEAKTLLAQIVGESPKFLRARVRLALYELEASGGKDTGKTIDGIRAALSDAQRDDGGAPDMSALSPADQVRHAELLVVEADRGAEDAIQRYEDAGNLYYRVWQTFGEEPCRAKAPECHGFDKILYNGARAFQAARIIGKAISLRKVLLDPQFGLHNGALGKIAPYEIGGIYQAIGEYDAAAEAYEQFAAVDRLSALAIYHWYFLAQPRGFPERLIGADPDFFLHHTLATWAAAPGCFSDEALAEYLRCFRDPGVVHAMCEDYRAGATIDYALDEADLKSGRKIGCPMLALWGDKGRPHKRTQVMETWRRWAVDLRGGEGLPCGHFLAEEAPEETRAALEKFFLG